MTNAPSDSPIDHAAPFTWTAGEPINGWIFETFFHPYAAEFDRALRFGGAPRLLRPHVTAGVQRGDPAVLQRWAEDFGPLVYSGATVFQRTTLSNPHVVTAPYPRNRVDFHSSSAFGQYNYELFFHAPLLIAKRLSAEGRYEEARDWLHGIFDPVFRSNVDEIGDDPSGRPWRFRPFRSYAIAVADGTWPQLDVDTQAFEAWQSDPFNPHLVAGIRVGPYLAATVMAYLDNLISWGDSCFRQDTQESVAEAVQIYLLALSVLGPRPVMVPRRSTDAPLSFRELLAGNTTASAAAELAETVAYGEVVHASADEELAARLPASLWAFCTPPNDRATAYWDTIEDRLFKIRNSLNLDGIPRTLALFAPPIDPAALVNARAAGLKIMDVASAISAASVPPLRFARAHAVAVGVVTQSAGGLGSALLAAMEKRDAEALAQLRSGQEVVLQTAMRTVRQGQLDEAREQVAASVAARAVTQARLDHYAGLIDDGLLELEKTQIVDTKSANRDNVAAGGKHGTAGILRVIPDPAPSLSFGMVGLGWQNITSYIANGFEAAANKLERSAAALNASAGMASVRANNARRLDDWKLQKDLAAKELNQLDRQIAAGQIRVQTASREAENLEIQITQSTAVQRFLETKYTNADLFDWQATQLAALHRSAFDLAVSAAKRAEQAYRYELGDPNASFVGTGQWQAAYKGLLAGERLLQDLQRMEAAYHDRNVRELEITKDISLAEWDPSALIDLRETGACFFDLKEVMLDVDTPGLYFRRLRHVAVSIPCDRSAQTAVPCKVSLVSSRIRVSGRVPDGGWEDETAFQAQVGRMATIITSTGNRDTGVVATGEDGRFLPFEGRGAFGVWRLELPTVIRPFDYRTISDVMLHLIYTARDGGGVFRAQVEASLPARLDAVPRARPGSAGRIHLSSLAAAVPEAFEALRTTVTPTTGNVKPAIEFAIVEEKLPTWMRVPTIAVAEIGVWLVFDTGVHHAFVKIDRGGTPAVIGELTGPGGATNMSFGQAGWSGADHPVATWRLRFGQDAAGTPEDLVGFDTTTPWFGEHLVDVLVGLNCRTV